MSKFSFAAALRQAQLKEQTNAKVAAKSAASSPPLAPTTPETVEAPSTPMPELWGGPTNLGVPSEMVSPDATAVEAAPAAPGESEPEQMVKPAPAKFSFATAKGTLSPADEYDDGAPPLEEFDHDEINRAQEGDVFEFGGIIQPKGMRTTSAGRIAGVIETAFDESPPDVPPGSHYEAWVWNAMDKEGCVTIELYVDDGLGAKDPLELSPLERAYKPVYQRRNPVFNAKKHCLISVPTYPGAPWGVAKRVLLTPYTERKLPDQKAKPRYDGKPPVTPPPQYVGDPAGISNWLEGKRHHSVIFGRCVVADPRTRNGESYWMVISKNDAKRVQEDVYGNDPAVNKEPRGVFGLEGVVPTVSVYNEATRRRSEEIVPEADRQPIPAAKRQFGWWCNADSARAIKAACAGAGPMLPETWSEADVEYVRNTHSTLRHQVVKQPIDKPETIIAPMPAGKFEDVPMPEGKSEQAESSSSIVRPRRSVYG